MYRIYKKNLKHSPRALRFWECCLAVFYENLSSFRQNPNFSDKYNSKVNINNLIHDQDETSFYLDRAFEYYLMANKNHRASYELEDENAVKEEIYTRTVRPNGRKNKSTITLRQEFIVNNRNK